eukprot:4044429-Prymnesium_polylepis.1
MLPTGPQDRKTLCPLASPNQVEERVCLPVAAVAPMWNGEDGWIAYPPSERVESIDYASWEVVTRPRPKLRPPSLSSLVEQLVEVAGGHVVWGATEAAAEAGTKRLAILRT